MKPSASPPAPDQPRGTAARAVASMREWLSEVDVGDLSDRERIDLVVELERLSSTAAATQARATHALRRSREAVAPQDAVRSVGAEVALARRRSPTHGDRLVGLARALVDEMPCTLAAMEAGSCSEKHALLVVQATSVLSVEHRAEVDRRVGPLLGRLGVRGAERAARRVAAELDPGAVVRRRDEVVRSRRVTVRPAPDGMAYLTVLGPLVEVVGAYASVRSRAVAVVGGQCPDEPPAGRAAGAVAADTALRLLSGRSAGEGHPVEVHLVMTDRSLLGTGDPLRSVMEPARIPGHGSLAAPLARALVAAGAAGEDDASVWLRRLYTSPDGRDLVAMDSRRRYFSGLLRRMLVLRDDVCSTPWCEAPIAHADHTTPARDDGPTSFIHGSGKCARCNYGKEAPGWVGAALGAHDPHDANRPRLEVVTPLRRHYVSQAPPLSGGGGRPTTRRPTTPVQPPQHVSESWRSAATPAPPRTTA